MHTETEQTQHLIPVYMMDRLADELEKLRKRARKLGLPDDIGFRQVGTKIVKRNRGAREYAIVEVFGQAPRIPGYTFLGTVDHSEAGNILRLVPSLDIAPARTAPFRTTDAKRCDHCGQRRSRKNTYLIESSSDQSIKQVGSTCLADFLGHPSPDGIAAFVIALASIADMISAMDEEDSFGGGSGGGSWLAGIESYLAHVHACVRLDGWVSSREDFRTSTAMCAWDVFFNINPAYRAEWLKERQPTADDTRRAAEDIALVREHFESKPFEALENYEANVLVLIRRDWVDWKNRGIAASLVRCADRIRGIEIAKKKAAVSEWFGNVKQRCEMTLTVHRTFEGQSDFGSYTIYIMRDDAGRAFKWKSTGQVNLEVGRTYRIKATIKAHETYDKTGERQTRIERGVVLAGPLAAAA